MVGHNEDDGQKRREKEQKKKMEIKFLKKRRRNNPQGKYFFVIKNLMFLFKFGIVGPFIYFNFLNEKNDLIAHNGL